MSHTLLLPTGCILLCPAPDRQPQTPRWDTVPFTVVSLSFPFASYARSSDRPLHQVASTLQSQSVDLVLVAEVCEHSPLNSWILAPPFHLSPFSSAENIPLSTHLR